MTRETLERRQVVFYLAAVLVGLMVGSIAPGATSVFEASVWPVIALLLYATFTQVPLAALGEALGDTRFFVTSGLGNFVVLPLAVWGLVQVVPGDEAALRLGLLLVLLVPCTDWFITFTQVAQGDVARATAVTPLNLVLQLLLLPVYLWLMTGTELTSVFSLAEVWPALLVVLAPLLLAVVSEGWFRSTPDRERIRDRLGWAPVPLLALVIFLVAAAHVGEARAALQVLPVVAGISVAFLVVALILAVVAARVAGLPAPQGRTLAFTFGTRNSFVVLPFALALPAGWELVAIVIVLQSLVELLGMVVYVWVVPRIFPARSEPRPS